MQTRPTARGGPRPRAWLALALSTAAAAGCVATTQHREHRAMREVVLALIEDQLIDNLVRLRQGLPIVHLDYTTLTGTVTLQSTGEAGLTATLPNDTLRFGLTVRLTDQMQLAATPVTNNNAIYRAYLSFAADAAAFRSTVEPPEKGAAHIVRERGGLYHWVPLARRDDFLQLALTTTVMRGTPVAPPEVYAVEIVRVEPQVDTVGDTRVFDIRITPAIENDQGTLIAQVEGLGRTELRFLPYDRPIDGDVPSFGEPTTRLRVRLKGAARVDTATVARSLAGQDATIRLDNHRPTAPSATELFDSIARTLEQIRLNELRRPALDPDGQP